MVRSNSQCQVDKADFSSNVEFALQLLGQREHEPDVLPDFFLDPGPDDF